MKFLALLCLCLTACSPDMDMLLAQAQARVYRATGVDAKPSKLYAQRVITCNSERTYAGCTDIATRRVWVATRYADEEIVNILVHELLHLIGCLGHVPAGHGIMGPARDSALNVITKEDLGMVCFWAPCRWQRPEQ